MGWLQGQFAGNPSTWREIPGFPILNVPNSNWLVDENRRAWNEPISKRCNDDRWYTSHRPLYCDQKEITGGAQKKVMFVGLQAHLSILLLFL